MQEIFSILQYINTTTTIGDNISLIYKNTKKEYLILIYNINLLQKLKNLKLY
jgi:hypothetical protein